jgi:ketosteroid isomerase-like protein
MTSKLPMVLWTLLSLAFAASSRAEQPDEKTKKEILEFVKAVKAKDVDEIMKHFDVPWLGDEQNVIKDKDELKKKWKERLEKEDVSTITEKVDVVFPAKDTTRQIGDEGVRKLFDQVLAGNGQIVTLYGTKPWQEWYMLMRTDGRTRFVGGPYKRTYLFRTNKIPAKAQELLDGAEELELYSLDPQESLDERKRDPKSGFHGYKVLGKTTVKDATTRKKLVASLKQGVDDNYGAVAGNCFDPRHGIQVTHKDMTMDFVICFQCSWVYMYESDKDQNGSFMITPTPQADFDKVLSDAKVPLAKKPK